MESSKRWHREEKEFGVFCLTEMAHFGQCAIASIHRETLESLLKNTQTILVLNSVLDGYFIIITNIHRD